MLGTGKLREGWIDFVMVNDQDRLLYGNLKMTELFSMTNECFKVAYSCILTLVLLLPVADTG
jgi:hypothetical protein